MRDDLWWLSLYAVPFMLVLFPPVGVLLLGWVLWHARNGWPRR